MSTSVIPHNPQINVFLSSTNIDLPDYRNAAAEALRESHVAPIMMEDFPAEDQDSPIVCEREVKKTQIFVGIYAYRYGFQPQGYNGKSITEMEFDWAVEKGIPCLIFVVDPNYKWTGLRDSDAELQKRLEDLKLRAGDGRVRTIFTTPDNLKHKIYRAIEKTKEQYFSKHLAITCRQYERPPAHFAGRADMLTTLYKELTAGTSVAVTALRGVGGMGKTTLAQKLAEQLATATDQPFGIMLWAGIGQKPSEETERAILRNWARNLGRDDLRSDQDAASLAPQVKAIIAHAVQSDCREPILLILDDVWPEESLAMAKHLLTAMPSGVRILVTTRDKTVVSRLNCTADVLLDKLSDSDGAQMLANLVYKQNAGKVTDATLQKLGELSQTLGGHPLALQLASHVVQERVSDPLETIIAEYDMGIREGEAFKKLDLEEGDEKDENVSVTLTLTYNPLSEPEQARFRALGALPMELGFSRDHLYAVWGLSDGSDNSTLNRFLRERLLESVPDQPGRYQQHRLLRAYARGLLREYGELEAEQQRHFEYIISFSKDLFQEEKMAVWDNFAANYPQIAAVGDELVMLVTGTDDLRKQDELLQTASVTVSDKWQKIVSDFGIAVHKYIYYRNANTNGRRWLWNTLIALEKENIENIAFILNSLGIWHRLHGFMDEAITYYEKSLSLIRSVTQATGEATILNNIGEIYRTQRNLNRALDRFFEALYVLRNNGNQEISDWNIKAVIINNIGGVYFAINDFTTAFSYLLQALMLSRHFGISEVEALALNNIGGIYRKFGRDDLALNRYQRSHKTLLESGNYARAIDTLVNIAAIYAEHGHYDEALQIYYQVLQHYRESGIPEGEATVLNNLAAIYDKRQELDIALSCLKEAWSIIQSVNNPENKINVLIDMADVSERTGDLENAIRFVEQAIEIEEQIGHSNLMSNRQYLELLRQKRNGN